MHSSMLNEARASIHYLEPDFLKMCTKWSLTRKKYRGLQTACVLGWMTSYFALKLELSFLTTKPSHDYKFARGRQTYLSLSLFI